MSKKTQVTGLHALTRCHRRKTQTHLQTPTASSIRSNYASIFAAKDLASFTDLDITLEVPTDKTILQRIEGATQACVRQLNNVTLRTNRRDRTARRPSRSKA